MPITSSAQKALRQEKTRTLVNLRIKNKMKRAIKQAKSSRDPKSLNSAYSTIDTATKKHILHKNKAARLKSNLSRELKSAASKPPKASSSKAKTKAKPKATKTASKKV